MLHRRTKVRRRGVGTTSERGKCKATTVYEPSGPRAAPGYEIAQLLCTHLIRSRHDQPNSSRQRPDEAPPARERRRDDGRRNALAVAPSRIAASVALGSRQIQARIPAPALQVDRRMWRR